MGLSRSSVSCRVVGVGEVLWDLLPSGRQLGGAPGNYACHARALGADAQMVSRVGDDELGTAALNRLRALGLGTEFIAVDSNHPTGTVSVRLLEDGQPEFEIHKGVAWDFMEAEPGARRVISEADALCFGTLVQRQEPSRSSVRELVAASRPGALRVLDVNLRQSYYSTEVLEASLALANVVKLNDSELPVLAGALGLAGSTREQLGQLAERFALRLIAYTRGARGSLLYRNGECSDHPGAPTTVADTVGAGDAFNAAMTLGILAGWALDEINRKAAEVAAYVCSRSGATPPMPETLRQCFAAGVQDASDAGRTGAGSESCQT